MKRLILVLLALAMLAGNASAYGITDPADITLGLGQSYDYSVTVLNSVGADQKFSVEIVDAGLNDASAYFNLEIDGVPTAFGDAVAWTGPGSKTFNVKITNVNAPNGQYQAQFNNMDNAEGKIADIALITSNITAIPEFPTVALPVAAILGLAFFMQRRKEE
jgi:hypothetical protein